MNRIDRLFGMITLLQSRRFVSAERFSEKFDISIRTVYRDIKALVEQGVPVGFEPGKGYFVTHGYFLPPVSFSHDEAAALILIENIVHAFSDLSVKKHYSSALNKIKAVVPQGKKEKLELLSNAVRSQHPERFLGGYERLTELQNAVVAKTIVEIRYKNNKEEISTRRIEPIGLVFYAFAWHVIAWCHLRHEYRDFKIERIHSLKDTGLAFSKTAHMAVADYMKTLPVNY